MDMSDTSRDICPNGDLILVIGSSKTRLRVFSQCLTCASRVFGVMLSPDWVEGQKLAKGISAEILLVEDNVPAMFTICCVIHHRNCLLPAAFTPHEILQIAIHADKYDLRDALRFAKTQWLQEREGMDLEGMACLMAASLLFHDLDMFIAHGRALMFLSTASFSTLLKHEEISQILPTKMICLLEERRNRMRAEMGELITGEIKSKCYCGWGKDHRNEWEDLSRQFSPLKMLDVPLTEVIDKIRFASYKVERKLHDSSYGNRYWHEPSDYVQEIAKKIAIAEKKVSICMRNDEINLSD